MGSCYWTYTQLEGWKKVPLNWVGLPSKQVLNLGCLFQISSLLLGWPIFCSPLSNVLAQHCPRRHFSSSSMTLPPFTIQGVEGKGRGVEAGWWSWVPPPPNPLPEATASVWPAVPLSILGAVESYFIVLPNCQIVFSSLVYKFILCVFICYIKFLPYPSS